MTAPAVKRTAGPRGSGSGKRRGSHSAGQMREALSAALERADADDAGGPLLRATGMRLRLHLTDVGLVVIVAASDDPERCIEWRFGDDSPWEAKLDLSMDSEVANRWL